MANKTKIEQDSTTITNPRSPIAESTAQKEHFPSKSLEAKRINTPLHPFIANNIRTTHYEIGPGGPARPTETADSFTERKGVETRFSLAPERINFFKDSHFVIGSQGQARA